MCLCPKTIHYRGNHFDPYLNPLMMQVPCGKCEECCKNARNDWFVRCWLEHQHSSVQSFFYTLTYNNEHLPVFDGLPVFCKRDLQLFMKRLRYNLGKGVRLRYFVSSEFGEKRGRCHYHVLFFLDRSFNPFLFYKIVEKSWKNGFVKYGDNGGIIYGTKGIQYVTKYVTKDLLYTDKFVDILKKKCFQYVERVWRRFERLYNIVPFKYSFRLVGNNIRWYYTYTVNRSSGYEVRSFYIDDVYKDAHKEDERLFEIFDKFVLLFSRLYRDKLPFHLQSTKLGAASFSPDNPVDDIPLLSSEHGVVHYSLPRYFRRLFWYDCVENEIDGKRTRFVLNEAGKAHLLAHVESDVKLLEDKYVSVISTPSRFDDDVLNVVNAALPSDYEFLSSADLNYFVKHIDLSLDVLAIYSRCFRGRLCPFEFSQIDLNEDLVRDNYVDYMAWSMDAICDFDFGRVYEDKVLCCRLERHMWNYHDFFWPYEFCLIVLDTIAKYYSGLVLQKLSHDDLVVRKLKETVKF